jgi:hypothetical protein
VRETRRYALSATYELVKKLLGRVGAGPEAQASGYPNEAPTGWWVRETGTYCSDPPAPRVRWSGRSDVHDLQGGVRMAQSTVVGFSLDSASIVYTDVGPGPDGEDATQIAARQPAVSSSPVSFQNAEAHEVSMRSARPETEKATSPCPSLV